MKKLLLFFTLLYGIADIQKVYAHSGSDFGSTEESWSQEFKEEWKREFKGLISPHAIMTILGFVAYVYMLKKMMETPSKAQVFKPSDISERFSSVAGAHEAKEELEDLVAYLKNPSKYKAFGAKIRKGVLMTGAPGNGKTLLARALAGEAGCPFIVINGSDFADKYLGGSADQVQKLFDKARWLAWWHGSCIVFIDEIDVIGRERGTGGNSEVEASLNKLLTELDGFQKTASPIVVIGATNRRDILDPALTRPGRIDRVIEVRLPDLDARFEILKIHSKGVNLDKYVNLKIVAKASVGFSGAELANLINEAALMAFKKNQKAITLHDLEEAIDTLRMGKESKGIHQSDEEKRKTAYHEAGHALVTLLLPKLLDPLHKVTILPRGGALGITWSIPEREKYSINTAEFLAYVKHALGGRIAEEIAFEDVSAGASSDFVKATGVVRQMVCRYGMSNLGNVVYTQGQESFAYSPAMASLIDKEVQRIMDKCYQEAKLLLVNNRGMLDKLAQELLAKQTLYARDIYTLLNIEPREDHKLL